MTPIRVGIGSHFARLMIPQAMAFCFLTIYAGEHLFASGNLALPNAAAITAASIVAILIILVLLLATRINRLESDLRKSSISDELTRLYNLRGFQLLGGQLLRDARRSGKQVTIVFFDADGLKAINDTFGHDAGSHLLLDIGVLLQTTFRGNDVVARVGGDEFAVLTQGGQSDVAKALGRLDEAIQAANSSRSRPYRLSVSEGVVTTSAQDDESLAELMARADSAMYENRRQRRVRAEPS